MWTRGALQRSRLYSTLSKVGFVGLGQMGTPMVHNLLKKFDNVSIFDSAHAAAAHFHGRTKITRSVDEMRDREVVFMMLPNAEAVRNTLFSKNGLAPSLPKGAIIVNTGTIGIGATKEIVRELGRDLDYIDTPVSGGIMGASNASLTFMASGRPESIAQITPILMAMGKKIVHCGDAGKGQAAKICNNMLLAITMLGASETYALAERLGLDAHTLTDIINSSSGRSWTTEINNPVPGVVPSSPASHAYKNGFSSQLLLKDIRLALDECRSTGLQLASLATTERAYEEMLKERPDLSTSDMSCMYPFILTQPK